VRFDALVTEQAQLLAVDNGDRGVIRQYHCLVLRFGAVFPSAYRPQAGASLILVKQQAGSGPGFSQGPSRQATRK
jgi:hypothetical protein